jgi:hypothetical protein
MQKGPGERDTECHIQPTLFGFSPLYLSGGYVRRYLPRHVVDLFCPVFCKGQADTSPHNL